MSYSANSVKHPDCRRFVSQGFESLMMDEGYADPTFRDGFQFGVSAFWPSEYATPFYSPEGRGLDFEKGAFEVVFALGYCVGVLDTCMNEQCETDGKAVNSPELVDRARRWMSGGPVDFRQVVSVFHPVDPAGVMEASFCQGYLTGIVFNSLDYDLVDTMV